MTGQFTPSGPDAAPVSDRGETVCVIGAGASGLAAIKNLLESGFEVDCYERETGVGGGWNWRHDRSPVYATTHLISSRPCSQFPDFPMPDDWPDYPHHSQVHAYLERYADHFGLREHIWFGTSVLDVRPAAGPGDGDPTGEPVRWDVTIRGQRGAAPRTMRYRAVIVANGHNTVPRMPAYEGLSSFAGQVIHSSGYKDSAQLKGKKVLVVGAGNSGCDIAVEAARSAVRCWHSTRRGYWYAPKYALGRPADQVNARTQEFGMPLWLRQRLVQLLLRLTVGDLTRYGLPAPDHKIYQTHPIVNGELLHQIGHGGVSPVGEIVRFERRAVVLADGRVVDPDLVIFATGYTAKFEFLDDNLLGLDWAQRPALRWQMFPPAQPTLAVIGLVQTDASLLRCAHWQSVLAARWLRALDSTPERAMQLWRQLGDADSKRFHQAKLVDSPRHWFEVTNRLYLKALEQALVKVEAIG